MEDLAKGLYQDVKAAHAAIYARILEAKARVQACNNMEEVADWAYAMREAEKFAEDLRKELGYVEELATKVACLLWVKTGTGDPIRTAYCTASPDVKMMARLPKRSQEPEQFFALMQHLGISPELAGLNVEHPVLKPHWPGMVDYVSEQLKQGKPLPPGMDSSITYPIYALAVRKKKDVA